MPRKTKPRVFDSKHGDVLTRLTAWLQKEMGAGSQEPLVLATRHLREHQLRDQPCRLCGAAKAIIDCVVSQNEQLGYELIEAIRQHRPELRRIVREIEGPLRRYARTFVAKSRDAGPAVDSVPGSAIPQGTANTEQAPAPKVSEKLARHSLGGRLMEVLLGFYELMLSLNRAEERVMEAMTIPSLKERRARWPRDLVETKVDCYLIEDGWTPKEIYPLHHNGAQPSRPSKYDYIGDRVLRARKSGKPQLLWGWRHKRDPEAERRLLELVAKAGLPHEGDP